MLATFTVTNLGDAPVTGADTAPGTLRQAIYDANHSEGPDLIQFADDLVGEIKLSAPDDSTIGRSALLVTSEMTISGNGNHITIKRDAAASEMRLFLVSPAGNLTLESLAFSGGVARGANGASGQDGGTGLGGAIYNQGSLLIFACTLFGDTAVGGNAGSGGAGGAGLGGALYNDGGTVSIRNSTLSGNSVSSGTGIGTTASFGGAVYSKNGALSVYNSTITANSASSGRDLYVIGVGQTATAKIFSAIIAHASLPVLGFDLIITEDLDGHVSVSGANNLIRSQNAYQSIAVSTADPLLGLLANNGGPTLTHALSANSPAIDHGSNPLNLTNDQRGFLFTRFEGGIADIGALELQTIPGQPLPGDYNGNHVVDAGDYVLWRKTKGADVPQFSGADGNGNGKIDVADYVVWRGQFGATSPESASVSISTGSAEGQDITTQSGTVAVDAAHNAPNSKSIALAFFGQIATHSSIVAARSESGRDGPARTEHGISVVSQRAREQALLAVVAENAVAPKPFAATIVANDEGDARPVQSETGDSVRPMERALSRALLQMRVCAAASIYTA